MSFNSLFVLFGIWVVIFCAYSAGMFEGIAELIEERRIRRATKKAIERSEK